MCYSLVVAVKKGVEDLGDPDRSVIAQIALDGFSERSDDREALPRS
jgi:hypothetical protein